MTPDEFKKRWESDDSGGGITWDDIAKCYQRWGLGHSAKTKPVETVLEKVLRHANTAK